MLWAITLNTVVRLFKEEKSCILQNSTIKLLCKVSLLTTALRREEKEGGLFCSFTAGEKEPQDRCSGLVRNTAEARRNVYPGPPSHPHPYRGLTAWCQSSLKGILRQMKEKKKKRNHHCALLLAYLGLGFDTRAFQSSFPENLLLQSVHY